MATKYSDLELAINTLVTEFHKAADNSNTINTTQFETMLPKQLPLLSKTVAECEGGVQQLLQTMGVERGQSISFENFWILINQEAIRVFGVMSKEKTTKCNCVLF
ncbi:uncharacterized protein LOC117505873 isoform X2 [Thalassophryne amazonica]|uniref:uncharacterized protein LOC117505873 isoform X2 n=1 Tax=Thalassophryne amazonica TaxID=390379 RepID=UPI00147157CC|nr:uncharacterized protein LOC117505873 isoform X2 [Thalassophryne amazonica]